MTPDERYSQYCRRIRIWTHRAMRRIAEGEQFIDGDWCRRSMLREFELAYQDGYRAALSSHKADE